MKLLISLDYIKQNFPILDYVSESDIMPYVKTAQQVYVEFLIGSSLLIKLTSNDVLTTLEEILKNDYVKPVLMHYTIYLYGRDTNFKFTNRGITKQFSDNSTSADLEEVIYKSNIQKDIAESYGNRVLKFIEKNKMGDCGIEGPAKTSFSGGGLYIPTYSPKIYNTGGSTI